MTTSTPYRQQRLVDLCFELAIIAHTTEHTFNSPEEIAQWVARQLKRHDFPTTPKGRSWGVLDP